MADERGEMPGIPALNPLAMPVAHAARMLARAAGIPISEEMLRADLAAGAPANADGTMNLLHYAAWLVRAMAKP